MAKQIPYCTLILVGGALFCHFLVLTGNLATSSAMASLGKSTGGWSNVGLQLSGSLSSELDELLQKTSSMLTNAIGTISGVQMALDMFIGDIGNSTEEAVSEVETSMNQSLLMMETSKAEVGDHQSRQPTGAAIDSYIKTILAFAKSELKSKVVPYVKSEIESKVVPYVKAEVGPIISEGVKDIAEVRVIVEGLVDELIAEKVKAAKAVVNTAAAQVAGAKDITSATIVSGVEYITDIKAYLPTIPELEKIVYKVSMEKLSDLHKVSLDQLCKAYNISVDLVKEQVAKFEDEYGITIPERIPEPWVLKSELKSVVRYSIRSGLNKIAGTLITVVSSKLDTLMEHLKPALRQIGKWLVTFGDKIQATIETFSTTIDRVQKIFDQLMSNSGSGGEGEEQMQYDTFTLFDSNRDGSICVQDLVEAAEAYGIEALAGKERAIHHKYDLDKDGELSEEEYAAFVTDPSIPDSMSYVLRKFAKKLSVISGIVGQARMRDEVAAAVVDYFTLICAKNHTKVQWVSNRLTNASIPMEFTADVLATLAFEVDNPEKFTKADVGQLVVNEMYRMEPGYVGESLKLMSDPAFWVSEGYDPTDQESAVEQVAHWIAAAEKEQKKQGASLFSVFANKSNVISLLGGDWYTDAKLEAFPLEVAKNVRARSQRYAAEKRAERARRLHQFYSTDTSVSMRSAMLGGAAASATADDPLTQMAVNSGQPAVPATLEFAKFLSWNASQTSNRFQKQCFEYSSTSSSTLDSFSDNIKGMVKTVQTFLIQMEEYSTPKGITRLDDMVDDFLGNLSEMAVGTAMDKVDTLLLDKVFAVLSSSVPNYWPQMPEPLPQIPTIGLAQTKQSPGSTVENVEGAVADASNKANDAIDKVVNFLATLQAVLPDVVKNLKSSRTKVSAAAEGLRSIFSIFEVKGPPIFDKVSDLYATLWVTYFVLFGVMTTSVLFYGFWASGWCGGPEAHTVPEDYQEPRTCWDRLCCCCTACSTCMKSCHDSNLCFWSCALVMEIIVLVLFAVSIALCILSGVKAFLSAGCSQIYVLNDGSICAGTLGVVKSFLETFWKDAMGDFVGKCEQDTLLTCDVIGRKLRNSTIGVTIGSVLAAVFTFQLIVESAIMHERARWNRSLAAVEKKI